MSYPIHSLPRGGVSRTVRSGSGFWGYDPSRNARDRSPERAADTENLIWKGDALGRRKGYSAITSLPATIYGIYFYGQELLVHAGTVLYRRTAEGSAFEPIFYDLKAAPSCGLLHYQQLTRRRLDANAHYGWHRQQLKGDMLFISDQSNLFFYDGVAVYTVADGFWGRDLTRLLESGAVFDFYATVPFTSVAKLPKNDPGDTDPRGGNRMSQFRAESFYVNESASSFQLNCSRAELNGGIPAELLLRDANGVWHTYAVSENCRYTFSGPDVFLEVTSSLAAGRQFLVDEEGRVIAWGEGDYAVAADNSDNLRILYAVIKEEPEALMTATAMGLFGADGAANVLFLGGSAVAPGTDSFSAAGDFTCFYDTSTEVLGSNAAPITGYSRLTDGRMAVLKNEVDGVNVYFRNHAVISMGASGSGASYQVDVFPSGGGAPVPGCVSSRTVGAVGNEPIFLTDTGLYTVKSVSDTLVNLNQTVHRSAAVDGFLREVKGSPFGISWKGYYLLCFGRDALITDGKRESSGALRFLKWRFSHEMTAFSKSGDVLWMGDADGTVYRMDSSDSDAGLPFHAFWRTALPEDSGGRRMLLKKLWASFAPDYQGSAEVTLIHCRCPDTPRVVALRRTDFSDWDFGSVCFDGTDSPRWILFHGRPIADCFAVELAFLSGQQLKLWGIRMQYEKGGVMA